MSHRDGNWEAGEDDVVRRLKEERPQISGLELDRIKTTVLSRVRPARAGRATSRFSWLVAVLTCGVMVAGTAGTIAAGNSSLSGGTGAAQAQYRPPKCHPSDKGGFRHTECKCPDHSIRVSRDRCVCPPGESFVPGKNDCRHDPSGGTGGGGGTPKVTNPTVTHHSTRAAGLRDAPRARRTLHTNRR